MMPVESILFNLKVGIKNAKDDEEIYEKFAIAFENLVDEIENLKEECLEFQNYIDDKGVDNKKFIGGIYDEMVDSFTEVMIDDLKKPALASLIAMIAVGLKPPIIIFMPIIFVSSHLFQNIRKVYKGEHKKINEYLRKISKKVDGRLYETYVLTHNAAMTDLKLRSTVNTLTELSDLNIKYIEDNSFFKDNLLENLDSMLFSYKDSIMLQAETIREELYNSLEFIDIKEDENPVDKILAYKEKLKVKTKSFTNSN